jgi:acyl-CoA synthetase (AMP-forming)/AMP-acid ligase II/acyl carrier protein
MKSLVEILCTRAVELPERDAYTFLVDGEKHAIKLTYRELDQRARSIAAQLETLCERGARALLLFPPGLDYIAAFCGCLYAGVVAVPAYPPRMNRNLQRLQAIVADSDAAVALTTTATLARIKPALAQQEGLENLRWLETDNLADDLADSWRMPDINRETLALLQYTSGSTATPKGVMVTHGNLLHNESMIQRAFRQTPDSIIVGWLPLYHDMGLIGTVLQPLFTGSRCVLMSHVAFLQRPARWLEAISRHRATTSGAPNFGYELCTRKVTTEERESLDLSSWTTAFNGSEPVRADTLEQFSKTFASCGFRASTFYPCYGLAEATLFVSGSLEPRVPHVKTFDAEALEQNRIVESDDSEARQLVSCGNTAPDQHVMIVNPETRAVCGPNEVGEIWVAGESVTAGYWKRPEETGETFGAHPSNGSGSFLRTGDLGFVYENELFITGRLKDLIIIRGRNLYPHDIERTVQESHPKLRSAAGAAFSIANGEERLVVVHEAERSAKFNYAEILSAIREVVAEEYEVQLYAVVIVKTGGVPRTSSGKIQRRACRELFLSNRLDVLAEWRESLTVHAKSPAVVTRPGHSIAEVETWLCTQLAQKLGVDVSDIDLEKPITHYGIDSVATVELMHALETGLGVVVPFTSFYRSPNIREIARETADQLGRHDDTKVRPLNRLPRVTTAIPRS